MEILNEELNNTVHIKCAAKASLDNEGPPKLTFQGYSGAAVDLSDYGFDYPVVYNIDGIETKQKIPIRYNHGEAVGHTTSIRKVDNRSALRGKGVASLPGENTTRIVEGIKNGFPWEASMGLRIVDWKNDIRLHQNGSFELNNRTFSGPHYIVNRSVLREMTVTENGRDSDTSFEFLNREKRMEILNASVTDEKKGTPPSDTSTPPAEVTTPPADTVENNKKDSADDKVDNTPAPVHSQTGGLDPLVRRSMSLLNKYPGKWELIEKGLENGWDDEAIENSIKLQDLNDRLPTPPSPGKDKGEDLHNMMKARMCLSFGARPESVEKKFGAKIANQAYDAPQMGIMELLVNAANSNGGNFQGYSDPDAVFKYINNMGYSSFDLPDFFESVATFMKEERWEINPPFAPTVCKEGSNRDFKITEKRRITGGDMWNQVSDDGKLDLYGGAKQKKYQTNLETYGSVFTFTRQEAANDDMDALTDLMDAMLEGAMMVPDYQLGTLMIKQAPAAASFWIDDDNSFDNTALTRANLSTAFNSIRQYNESKERFNWNVMLNDRWSLIVSPNLEETAWEILKQDKIVNDTTANTKTGEKNYWFGRMDLKVFGQMANTSAFGSTSKFVGNTTWILWPSSQRFAPYEITYYRGMKKPTVESIQLPGTLLGFGIRGYWDVKINERERTAVARYTATA